MRAEIRDLVYRMTGRADVAAICARAVGDGSDGEGAGGGDVCCRLRGEDAALVGEVPQIATSVDERTDPDTVATPFVLFGDLLYTRRSWRYEQIVRRRVSEMAACAWMPDAAAPEGGEYAGLRAVDQRPAVPLLLASRFSMLSGGPGTGKTYTLGKAVKLMLERNPGAMVALAAPTGKAAARINESLEELKRAGLLEGVRPATTLHALLEPRADLVTFRRCRSNPLPLDWLVVDEASMIDLPLMAKLLDALPPDCSLTLTGDAHQLASVEQGRVFGDLAEMFAGNLARLTVSSRFPPGGEIDRLARAVNGGGPGCFESVRSVLAGGEKVSWTDIGGADAGACARAGFERAVADGFGAFAASAAAEEALERLGDFRVLCALRGGPYGVEALNRRVAEILGRGRPEPLMVLRNDRTLELHNGDVGVVMPQDPLHLCLRTLSGGVRRIRLELLPETEPAFATTIHKSQGSEFKDVAIVLPPAGECPLLTRETLYTGITRTRGRVFLYAGADAVRACCERSVERTTGLAVKEAGACSPDGLLSVCMRGRPLDSPDCFGV